MRPFLTEKVPICRSVDEVRDMLLQYPCSFCLYLAEKTDAQWETSMSRVQANRALESFIYLPVNIPAENIDMMRDVCQLAQESDQIIAINLTQPHKGSGTIRRFFDWKEPPTNFDALIKRNNVFTPIDMNGPAFVTWYKEVGELAGKSFVLIGVGGAGEAIARAVSDEQPKEIILIDKNPKDSLAQELAKKTKISYMNTARTLPKEIVLVNATGKSIAELGLATLFSSHHGMYIDLRTHADDLDQVDAFNWPAYDGQGMSHVSDYALICEIAEVLQIEPPSFDEFKKLI
jgi:hypothetical protein